MAYPFLVSATEGYFTSYSQSNSSNKATHTIKPILKRISKIRLGRNAIMMILAILYEVNKMDIPFKKISVFGYQLSI